MPRWLIASILAIVLSCYGFAALAQNVVGVHAHGQASDAPTAAQMVADLAAPSVPADDSPFNDAIDTATGHAEPGFDHAEAVDAFQRIARPLRLSEAPARRLPTVTPSPLLERPKRPPRGALASA